MQVEVEEQTMAAETAPAAAPAEEVEAVHTESEQQKLDSPKSSKDIYLT